LTAWLVRIVSHVLKAGVLTVAADIITVAGAQRYHGQQFHVRRDLPEFDPAFQQTRRLDAGLGTVVEPVAGVRVVESRTGRARRSDGIVDS